MCVLFFNMFFKDRINSEATYTYTQTMLNALRRVREVKTSSKGTVFIGWPTDYADALKGPKKYAQDLYPAVKAFYDLHFPDEEWRAHFAAFDLGNDLTLSTRLQSLRALARNEGQDGDKAVRAFTHVFPRARQM